MNVTHTHHHEGQTLEHAHPGGGQAHGYFEHPEDGSRATVVTGTTPLADALAEVDKAMSDGYTSQGEMRPHLSRALWHLSEAVRASLLAFPEQDIRALAVTAAELYCNDYKGAADEYLTDRQHEVLDKARNLFGGES
jgi:hypothetical protein